MSAPPPTLDRPAYCPNCGYDLRGASTPVCSECGATVGKGIASQIPWMQRRWRGTIPAYLATARLVVLRPSLFVSEILWRLPSKNARKFLHWTHLLASLLFTALCAVAFAFHGIHWRDCMPDVAHVNFQTLERPQFTTWPVAAFALWDSWFVLIPFFLTTLLTVWLTQGLYRRLLALGTAPARFRRRLDRLGMYLSAIALWEVPLLGLFAITTMIQMESYAWAEDFAAALLAMQLMIGALAVLLFYGPSIVVIARTGTPSSTRKWYYLLILWAVASFKTTLLLGDWESPAWLNRDWSEIAAVALVGLFAATFLGLIIALVLRSWRSQSLRILYLLVFYPPACALIFLASAATVFWLCGYVALAVGSMLRG